MVFSNSQKSSPTLKQLSSYLVDIIIPKIAKKQNFIAVTYRPMRVGAAPPCNTLIV